MDPGHELLISSDSHVIEHPTLWVDRLERAYRADAPRFPMGAGSFAEHRGGSDPHARLTEMAEDGVSAEVLYPTLTLNLFHLEDAGLQEACFRVYNDWISEYCHVALERLIGIGAISLYDIDNALKELVRCKELGLRGCIIWQLPPEDYPFYSKRYEPFWEAAQDLALPVSLHILTGFDWSRRVSSDLMAGRASTPEEKTARGEFGFRGVVNDKLRSAMHSLHDIIVSGVLERFPRLKIVLVECEIGWLPFVLNQWDKYYGKGTIVDAIVRQPSDYFERQVYATFFNDPPGARQLAWWGADNCMWSNDFRDVSRRDLGGLSEDVRSKLLWHTCADLYDISVDDLVRVGSTLP